jgi:hypothetical protein
MGSLACETPPNETGVVVEVEVLAAGELVGWDAYY